jgi:hypothetical protein
MQNNLKKDKELFVLYGETVIKLISESQIGSSNITYAIPMSYEDQVPISFEIKDDTSPKIIEYQIINDKNPPNKLIKFNIGPLKKNEKITIHFSYWILVKNRKYKDIPKNAVIPKENELPEFSKQWLVSTKAIQSDNLFIKIKARTLRRFNNNLMYLSKKIFFSVCYHRPILSAIRDILEKKPLLRKTFLPNKYWTGLMDAVSGLFFGGLCATKANLEVALLRANGIPSRILIVNPLHYYSKKIEWIDALHYIVEFYIPNYGWVRAMSGRIPYQSKNDIILRIVYPVDENNAGNGLSFYGGMEPWFWFSNNDLKLDFPEDLFKLYKKTKNQGIPITTGTNINSFKIESGLADQVFRLTLDNWRQFIIYFGKKLDNKNQKIYDNTIQLQKKVLQDLKNTEINNYIQNMKKIYDLFTKITD